MKINKKGKMSNLELAANILWGEEVNYENCVLTTREDNPEALYLFKETMENLSNETKLLMSVIYNLPDEMFDLSGKIINKELSSWMRRVHNWKISKLNRSKQELKLCFNITI